jgi:Ni/Co efflux regulator RcnB
VRKLLGALLVVMVLSFFGPSLAVAATKLAPPSAVQKADDKDDQKRRRHHRHHRKHHHKRHHKHVETEKDKDDKK